MAQLFGMRVTKEIAVVSELPGESVSEAVTLLTKKNYSSVKAPLSHT